MSSADTASLITTGGTKMMLDTTAPALPAIPELAEIVVLSVSAKPWGGEGSPQKWDATLNGEMLVTRQRDPEHAACRALADRGITGRVRFVHATTGKPGLSTTIAAGARLVAQENDRGLYSAKFKPFDATVLAGNGIKASAGTSAAVGGSAALGNLAGEDR